MNYIGVLGSKYVNDNPSAYAKSEINQRTGKEVYYVKVATLGNQAGHLVDPWSIYAKSGEEQQTVERFGRKAFEYRKVSREVFDLYVRYLETQSSVSYRQAEREMI